MLCSTGSETYKENVTRLVLRLLLQLLLLAAAAPSAVA